MVYEMLGYYAHGNFLKTIIVSVQMNYAELLLKYFFRNDQKKTTQCSRLSRLVNVAVS